MAPGQRATVWATATATTDWGTRRGPFYVYLLRGLDGSVVQRAYSTADPGPWWSTRGAEAIRVARVEWGGRVSFTVPSVAAGTYQLMLCTAGCARPMGDVIPTPLTVLGDRHVAEHAQRLDRIEQMVDDQMAVVRSAGAANAEMWRQIARLRAAVRAANRREPPQPGTPIVLYAGWLVAGIALGVLATVLVRRRRRGAATLTHPTRAGRSSGAPAVSAGLATRTRRAARPRARRARA